MCDHSSTRNDALVLSIMLSKVFKSANVRLLTISIIILIMN